MDIAEQKKQVLDSLGSPSATVLRAELAVMAARMWTRIMKEFMMIALKEPKCFESKMSSYTQRAFNVIE